jgi:hypothetical protein
VHAIAVGPAGRVYAATSPDGAVYAIDAAGKATRFFDPAERYVWALAFEPSGALCVATGGEGRVYRVTPDGKSETLLASSETHVLSLAVDGHGHVFAGSAPEGIVYRIDAPGRVFVLLDSAYRIKASIRPDGSLTPRLSTDGRPKPPPDRRPRPPLLDLTTSSVVAEVTVRSYWSSPPAAHRSPWAPEEQAAPPAQGGPAAAAPDGRDRHPVDLHRRRAPLGAEHSFGRARGHGGRGQGLPGCGRRPLDPRGHRAGRAGHGPRPHLREGHCPRHV